MNRWLLKDKQSFINWLNAGDHIGKNPIDLGFVGTPNVYPVIICWQWFRLYDENAPENNNPPPYRLAHTFVAPHDFEFYIL